MRPRQHRVTLSRNKGLITREGMVAVPPAFKPAQNMQYPADNAIAFERWYMENYADADASERMYLPIQWTALYCNNNFGKCHKTKLHIQSFLDALDRSKKYYTIVQYDDGILNSLKHLDIKVFAMSGPRIDYALPLLCTPHRYEFKEERDIFASFVGRVTHPIRAKMIEQVKDLPGYYISTKPHKMEDYCRILARSKYALCPRGYGQTSFRIQEAIQYGAVPVYISDIHIFPYKSEDLPFLVHAFDWAPDLSHYMNLMDVDYDRKMINLNKSRHQYTYQGCKLEILAELNKPKQDEVQ